MHGAFPFQILSSSLGQCRAGFERVPENLNPHGAVPLLHILQHGIATRSSRGELDGPIVVGDSSVDVSLLGLGSAPHAVSCRTTKTISLLTSLMPDAVSDSSPLIHLAKIEALELISRLIAV